MECSQALRAKIYSPLTGKTLKWGRKQQYIWTVLPQGFTGPPIYLGKVLEQILEQFQPPKEELLLQNVDDRLLSGQEKTVVKEATNKLFNFLGKQGLGVLKNKLQYVEREVRYLRHLMSEGKQRINAERIQGIVEN